MVALIILPNISKHIFNEKSLPTTSGVRSPVDWVQRPESSGLSPEERVQWTEDPWRCKDVKRVEHLVGVCCHQYKWYGSVYSLHRENLLAWIRMKFVRISCKFYAWKRDEIFMRFLYDYHVKLISHDFRHITEYYFL